MGCTGALFENYGSFQPSTIATENFEKFIVNNDYDYFLNRHPKCSMEIPLDRRKQPPYILT